MCHSVHCFVVDDCTDLANGKSTGLFTKYEKQHMFDVWKICRFVRWYYLTKYQHRCALIFLCRYFSIGTNPFPPGVSQFIVITNRLPLFLHWLHCYLCLCFALTHWGLDKMDAKFLTTFYNAFSWIKIIYEFRLRFHLRLSSSLVQIMAWRRPGDQPLSEPVTVNLLTHICITRPLWVNVSCKGHVGRNTPMTLYFAWTSITFYTSILVVAIHLPTGNSATVSSKTSD